MNILVLVAAALIPMLLGFIWYHPKVMGTLWMKECGLTEEKLKGSNMILIFGLSLVFSFMLAFSMQFMVIHQTGVFGSLYFALKDPARMADATAILEQFQEDGIYAKDGRTFRHGALHGAIAALFVMLPVLATNAMFERKSFKYVFVNGAYWFICFTLMGAVIAAWL